MNVFIIGVSGSGKSTLTKRFVELRGFCHVKPSASLRHNNSQLECESAVHYVHRITNTALSTLRTDPDHFLNQMREQSGAKNVYDGVRNPRDFMLLFNPRTDLVIHVRCINGNGDLTDFEHSGVSLIVELINWMHTYLGAHQLIKFEWQLGNASKDLDDFVNHLKID